MKTILLIVIGIISVIAIVISVLGVVQYQSAYNQRCNSDGGFVVDFLRCTYIHEDFPGPKIEGNIADEICSITGGECPSYYIGNIQEDGSIMVGMTFSNGTQEKQFVFFIKNETLNYEERVNGKLISESESEQILEPESTSKQIPEPESKQIPETKPTPKTTFPSGLQVKVTGEQQVRRGITHDITVDVTRDGHVVPGALVIITIEDYGENVIRDYEGRTDNSGRFVFSWEIPKSFDDIETLLAYVDVTDDISAKTILFKFQVYCIPGEVGCKVEGN